MIKPKTVFRFLFIFFVVYTCLMVSQTGKEMYARFFCFTGNKLFHHFDDGGTAVLATQKGKDNIILQITSKALAMGDQTGWFTFNRSSDHIGYWHTVFLLSLIIATPLKWKRKFIALAAGFMLMTCVGMIKLRFIISYCCAITPKIGLYAGPGEKESAVYWNKNFGTAFSVYYSIAILIWLIVCIGKNEWRQLNGLLAEQMIVKQQTKGKAVKKTKGR